MKRIFARYSGAGRYPRKLTAYVHLWMNRALVVAVGCACVLGASLSLVATRPYIPAALAVILCSTLIYIGLPLARPPEWSIRPLFSAPVQGETPRGKSLADNFIPLTAAFGARDDPERFVSLIEAHLVIDWNSNTTDKLAAFVQTLPSEEDELRSIPGLIDPTALAAEVRALKLRVLNAKEQGADVVLVCAHSLNGMMTQNGYW